jgi:hypothetical protein
LLARCVHPAPGHAHGHCTIQRAWPASISPLARSRQPAGATCSPNESANKPRPGRSEQRSCVSTRWTGRGSGAISSARSRSAPRRASSRPSMAYASHQLRRRWAGPPTCQPINTIWRSRPRRPASRSNTRWRFHLPCSTTSSQVCQERSGGFQQAAADRGTWPFNSSRRISQIGERSRERANTVRGPPHLITTYLEQQSGMSPTGAGRSVPEPASRDRGADSGVRRVRSRRTAPRAGDRERGAMQRQGVHAGDAHRRQRLSMAHQRPLPRRHRRLTRSTRPRRHGSAAPGLAPARAVRPASG